MLKTAILSEDGVYRYLLTRQFSQLLGESLTPPKNVLFIGVNPSTADALNDDPTVRKWTGFTSQWGFDSFSVVNLFAHRSTDVKALERTPDPIGPDNDANIIAEIERADLIVPCWGARGKLPKSLWFRIEDVLAMIGDRPMKCLGTTLSGDPVHPLFISYTTPLTDYAHLYQHKVQAEAKVEEAERRNLLASRKEVIHSAENAAVQTYQFY